MNIAKYKDESYSQNVIVNFPSHADGRQVENSYTKLMELDKTLIGTADYMGFAWFWGTGGAGVKHYLRDATAKQKKIIHDSFILNNVPMSSDTIQDSRGYITTYNYFEDTEEAVSICQKVMGVA